MLPLFHRNNDKREKKKKKKKRERAEEKKRAMAGTICFCGRMGCSAKRDLEAKGIQTYFDDASRVRVRSDRVGEAVAVLSAARCRALVAGPEPREYLRDRPPEDPVLVITVAVVLPPKRWLNMGVVFMYTLVLLSFITMTLLYLKLF